MYPGGGCITSACIFTESLRQATWGDGVVNRWPSERTFLKGIKMAFRFFLSIKKLECIHYLLLLGTGM